MYVGLGLVIAIILSGLALNLAERSRQDHAREEAQSLARALQSELVLADNAAPGYHRTLDLPPRLQQGSYTLTNDEETLTITAEGTTITMPIPETQGTLTKGLNVITNDPSLTITH